MIKTHKIKIDEEFADAVLCGDKNFEIRKNDRGYQKGDHVIFDVEISINYPLGDYMGILDLPDYVTVYFENYNIIVNKGV